MLIVKYPDPILITPCQEVTNLEEAKILSEKMFKFMGNLAWGDPVGLAANQVGIKLRMFIVLGALYINPVLETDKKEGKKKFREGCYSLEDNRFDYKTERFRRITLTWIDLDKNVHRRSFTGFTAQVIQHEYDHIEGKTCLDY